MRVWTAGLILHRRLTLNPLPCLHHLLSLPVSTENRASQPTCTFLKIHMFMVTLHYGVSPNPHAHFFPFGYIGWSCVFLYS